MTTLSNFESSKLTPPVPKDHIVKTRGGDTIKGTICRIFAVNYPKKDNTRPMLMYFSYILFC